jgi:hypothetical protein
MEQHYYGLVWITSIGNDKAIARRIEKALVGMNFAGNLHQVVKV